MLHGRKYLEDKIRQRENSDAGVMAGIQLRLLIVLAILGAGWLIIDRIVALVAGG